MEFNEYQQLASKTVLYAKQDDHYKIMYLSMGIAGETGEVVEKIKKIARGETIVITDERREDLKKEIGDVLWYVSQLALHLGVTLDDVATHNIKKLADRAARGVIHGQGDTR